MYVLSSSLNSLPNDYPTGPCYIMSTSHPLSFGGHNARTFTCGSSRKREYRPTKSHIRLTSCHSQRTPAPPTVSSTLAPTTFITRLANWWPVHAGHVGPPIVDVPLAQG